MAATDDSRPQSPPAAPPGFLPFSTFMPMVNPDPHMREIRSFADSLIARIPGWSSTLPPARDIYGDPVLVPSGLTSRQQHPKGILSVNRELDEMRATSGFYLSPPAARSENTGGVDLRDFKLAGGRGDGTAGRTAYDRYQELSGHPPGQPPLSEALSNLVQMPAFKALPHGSPMDDGTREHAFMDVVRLYRQAGWRLMLAESPELLKAVNQRKLDVYYAASLGVKDPKLVSDEVRAQGFSDLLRTYGITR